jgi:GGDEF domain-containing protein
MVTRRSAQSILAEVSATLASSLAAADILATVARQIGEAMGVFSCDIWDCEPGAPYMTFVATWCAAAENPYGDAVGDTAELSDWDNMRAVIDDRQTIELHSDDPDLPATDQASFDKWGFRTTIDTPLVYGDRVIGVLGLVESRELRRFTPTERKLFAQLAVQAAIAIHNAQAFRRLEEQNRQLQALREIGNALTSTLVFEEALDVMAREAAEALGVSRCIINVYSEGEDLLTPLVVSERLPQGGAGGPAGHLPAARPSGRALLGRGTQVEQASDLRLDSAVRAELTQRGERTSLSVPLTYKGQPLGLMRFIETREERRFTADEIELARGIGEQAALAFQSARLYRSLQEQADTDGLTGLCNHRRFRERLYEEVVRARRYNLPLTMLMIDIDDFKAFNDDFGHLIGDEVLRLVAGLLQAGLRQSIDLTARYGGEEFAVLLPNTLAEGAASASALQAPSAAGLAHVRAHRGGGGAVAERIRTRVEDATGKKASGVPRAFTVSIGVATLAPEMPDSTALVRAADDALYEAKRAGKNTVVIAG